MRTIFFLLLFPTVVQCQLIDFKNDCEILNIKNGNNISSLNNTWKLYINYKDEHKPVLLDFHRQKICILSPYDEDYAKQNGFNEVKSKFTKDGIKLYFIIRWKEYGFTFNPDFNGSFTMTHCNDLPFLKFPYETIIIQQSTATTAQLFSNMSVEIDKIKYTVPIIVAVKAKQMVGFEFLRGFDWLIDIDNRKIYFRKNELSILTDD